MRNPIKLIKRRINYHNSPDRKYRDCWYGCPLNDHYVMIESGRGETVSGNMFHLLKEIETNEKWAEYKPFFIVTEKTIEEAREKMDHYGFKKVSLVMRMSDDYLKLLATCKYFFTDNTYPPIFCKKRDQVLVSTWHGTPLKHMGKAVLENARGIGNVQRNFFMADYILFPNYYTRDIFLNDYLLKSQLQGSIEMMDYPRNDAFFDNTTREKIREECGVNDKKAYAYMPTWRGGDANSVEGDKQVEIIAEYLNELDSMLRDEEIMYLNLHPFVGIRLSYDGYIHIKPFPRQYDTYDFLNITDALVTDYSSVFFDYAQSGRSVVLFAYDYEGYMEQRGTYIDIKDLPFDICKTPAEVLKILRKGGSTADKDFIEKFCKFRRDEIRTSEALLDAVINGDRTFEEVYDNSVKENEKLIHIIATTKLGNSLSDEIRQSIEKHTQDGEHVTVVFDGGVKSENVNAVKEIEKYDNTDWYSLVGGIRDFDMPREVQRLFPKWHTDTLEVKGDLRRTYNRLIRHLIPVSNYMLNDCGDHICISFTQKRLSYLKSARVGDYECELIRNGNRYTIDIPKEDLSGFMFRNRITLVDDFGVEHKIISGYRIPKLLKIIHTKVIEIKDSDAVMDHSQDDVASSDVGMVCYLQEYRVRTDLLVRPANYTDKLSQRIIIGLAYVIAKIIKGRKNPIVLYEKNSERYEESASILYERLLDMGYDNAYYVIKKNCSARMKVPDGYRSNLIAKYSFRHYLTLFRCHTFISTERITHNIDLRPLSPFLRYWLAHAGYHFVFLQHGVMYMVSLDAERRTFFKLRERPGYKVRIVVSSDLEAEHFIHRGGVSPEELYKCGLLKFDKAVRNETHDLIVIMPTWRPGEANLARDSFEDTSYYKFVMKIYNAVPDELKSKVVVLPHPLIIKSVTASDNLCKLMRPELTHEEILRMTDTLITDYSSISYDAFYRGANVIFDWEEKDDTVTYYGKSARLMLTEDLAFGKVCYDIDELREAIKSTYGKSHTEEEERRFNRIVEFNDGHNTDRLIEMLKGDSLI